jgi:hypothetical protein
MDTLPFSGALWPTLADTAAGYWYNDILSPYQWYNIYGMTTSFYSYIWPNPGPGAPWRPIGLLVQNNAWINNSSATAFWQNILSQNVNWANVSTTPIFPPGGSTLWTNDKCVITLWHNNPGDNVTFSQIYPNGLL